MDLIKLKVRIGELISLADKVISTGRQSEYSGDIVSNELFQEFRSSALSFLEKTFGEKHTYYKEFKEKVKNTYKHESEEGRGILKTVKNEIDGGWIFTVKGLVSSEIFSDFLEWQNIFLKKDLKMRRQ